MTASKRAVMFYTFLWIGLVLQLARAKGECTPTPSGGPETCKACDAVINGKEYCSQCNDSGSELSSGAPTNGVCTADNAVCSAKKDGVCTTCKGESFMYKGGCYAKADEPGNTVCETVQNGVCTAAKAGYFVPPENDRDASHQSAIPCGSEEEIVVKNDHKYKGVPHCTQCNTPEKATDTNTAKAATCTACENGYFVDSGTCTACAANCLTCAGEADNKCKSCTAETHFLASDASEGPCISCGDATQGSGAWKGVAGCAKCTKPQSAGPATCTECAADKYLKTDSGATSCMSAEECKDGFFPTTDAQNNNKKVCAKCGDTGNGGIEDCAKCSLKAASAGAGPLVTCSECSSKKLSPLGDACLENCPAGTYPDNRGSAGICAPCHNSCANCSDNADTSCTACYPGYVLKWGSTGDTGTCIKECTGDFMAHCKSGGCTLNVGGSKYCDQCEDGYAPVDGVCISVTPTARDASGCKASGGKCTECGPNYALLSGGCYNTNKVPGNSVCETADGTGKCTKCANGQAYADGNCPSCSEGCGKCATNTNQCDTCYSGYYKTATHKCFKCATDSDSGIKGVENCISCAPPTSPPGSVICYVKTDGTSGGGGDSGSGGGSTNKSGLSTGAIAGIAVAVIVVVGGLVGFLCWWFICRGKA
ncbi:VSP [Giardia lamblia P15]|uniref:VSP n=2 Tax=Giardia intestinalis (strain P15) TaxID=658858 RepID=E1EZI5_GIAIA|nr:VSP [Giardia lamblia P15]